MAARLVDTPDIEVIIHAQAYLGQQQLVWKYVMLLT